MRTAPIFQFPTRVAVIASILTAKAGARAAGGEPSLAGRRHGVDRLGLTVWEKVAGKLGGKFLKTRLRE